MEVRNILRFCKIRYWSRCCSFALYSVHMIWNTCNFLSIYFKNKLLTSD